ncbi:MAG: hypothetical protein JWQ11_3190 [Rhizobacter sp.]|nr:hypothetical protein [Rhizobacter sp.]
MKPPSIGVPAERVPRLAAPSRFAAWRALWRSRLLCEHWRIGVIDAPIHHLLGDRPLPPIRWLTGVENDGYWADPFALPGDASRVFAERFDERSGLGQLQTLELRDGRLHPMGVVRACDAAGHKATIGHGLHASFPHVFELEGQAFGVAETGAARECVLWRVDERGRWHSPTVLMSDVAAADPAIFQWQGRFWLAFTDADAGVHHNLCLFHADRLEGPYGAHSGNPVRNDAGGARMAGRFFEHEGVLYRPGQDCRTGYGAAVMLYRVDECSPTAWRETLVRTVAPARGSRLPDGLHTLTAWGDRTLVDGKRLRVNTLVLQRKAGAVIERLLARHRNESAKAAPRD